MTHHTQTHVAANLETEMGSEAMLSERLRWLRTAKSELIGLVTVAENRLQRFQATVHMQEESLLKRVKRTYEAERQRAHEHHQVLSEPLRHSVAVVEHQLAHLEALADTLVASLEIPSVEETRLLLTQELPLPLPVTSPGAVQESWERVCPVPRWRLTCDVQQGTLLIAPSRSDVNSMSNSLHADELTSWMPRWPSPERANFKGGTSLPLPLVDSESSGPEEMSAGQAKCVPVDAARERPHRKHPVALHACTSSLEDSTSPEECASQPEQFERRGGRGHREKRSDEKQTKPDSKAQNDDDYGRPTRSRELSSNWVKQWLDSNQLNDLIETTAEIEAIKRLEHRRSVAHAKRRLGLRR